MNTLRIAIPLPDFLCRPAISILLFYRRIKYGYAFRRIPLTEGRFAIVDADDYHRLAMHTWIVKINKTSRYASSFRINPVNGRQVIILMHREIMMSPKGLCVDHINGNGLDNRKANLRHVTQQQNNWNTKKVKSLTSRFKGVSWSKSRNKWHARIMCNRKTIFIGSFEDEEAAARAYDARAAELFGPYAWKNFT